MDRRGFLRGLCAGVAGIALQEAVPLGRVWSFPSKIVVPEHEAAFALLNGIIDKWHNEPLFVQAWDPRGSVLVPRVDVLFGFGNLPIGSDKPIRYPQEFVIPPFRLAPRP